MGTATGNFTYTATYIFDSAKRVSTVKDAFSNLPGYNLYEYSYY
jgi:hypothetical protein